MKSIPFVGLCLLGFGLATPLVAADGDIRIVAPLVGTGQDRRVECDFWHIRWNEARVDRGKKPFGSCQPPMPSHAAPTWRGRNARRAAAAASCSSASWSSQPHPVGQGKSHPSCDCRWGSMRGRPTGSCAARCSRCAMLPRTPRCASAAVSMSVTSRCHPTRASRTVRRAAASSSMARRAAGQAVAAARASRRRRRP